MDQETQRALEHLTRHGLWAVIALLIVVLGLLLLLNLKGGEALPISTILLGLSKLILILTVAMALSQELGLVQRDLGSGLG